MNKTETTKKIKLPNSGSIKTEIFKSKYTKIAFGTLVTLVSLAALGSILNIANNTIANYKNLKTTLNR
jgi:hypothetical protein